ncbi:MAG: DUF4307 domain-containing protein [Pontimonas sp.]
MSREDVEASPSVSHEISRPASRYGLSERSVTRNKSLGVLAGVGAAVVLVAWLWWAGLSQPNAQFETRDLGWQEVDERTISVSFQVTVEPGTPMSCAIQALNAQYGIVGWVIADIPPAMERTRVFSQEVRTSETAVTGLLYRCWLT